MQQLSVTSPSRVSTLPNSKTLSLEAQNLIYEYLAYPKYFTSDFGSFCKSRPDLFGKGNTKLRKGAKNFKQRTIGFFERSDTNFEVFTSTLSNRGIDPSYLIANPGVHSASLTTPSTPRSTTKTKKDTSTTSDSEDSQQDNNKINTTFEQDKDSIDEENENSRRTQKNKTNIMSSASRKKKARAGDDDSRPPPHVDGEFDLDVENAALNHLVFPVKMGSEHVNTHWVVEKLRIYLPIFDVRDTLDRNFKTPLYSARLNKEKDGVYISFPRLPTFVQQYRLEDIAENNAYSAKVIQFEEEQKNDLVRTFLYRFPVEMLPVSNEFFNGASVESEYFLKRYHAPSKGQFVVGGKTMDTMNHMVFWDVVYGEPVRVVRDDVPKSDTTDEDDLLKLLQACFLYDEGRKDNDKNNVMAIEMYQQGGAYTQTGQLVPALVGPMPIGLPALPPPQVVTNYLPRSYAALTPLPEVGNDEQKFVGGGGVLGPTPAHNKAKRSKHDDAKVMDTEETIDPDL